MVTNDNINNNEEVSFIELFSKLKEWFNYLLSMWIVVTIFGLFGGALGFYYTFSKKAIYTATTTFVLEDDKGGSGVGSLLGLASMAGVDLGGNGGGVFQGDNILELYRSRRMIEKALLKPDFYSAKPQLLVDRYIEFNKLREVWDKDPKLKNIRFDTLEAKKPVRNRDSLMNVIVGNISKNYLSVVKPDKKLSIIKTVIKAPDEIFAKAFNEQLVKTVNDFYKETKIKKSRDNVKILSKKADSVRNVMNGAVYSAAITSDVTPNLNPTRQVQRVVPMQRSQITIEANKAILSELVKNLELSRMSLLKETPLIQVVDEPIFPLTMDKMSKIKGIIIGGIIAGFLICLVLIVRKIFLKASVNSI